MYFTRIVISHRLTPSSRNAAISGAFLSTWPASQLRPPSLTAVRWTALPAQLVPTCKAILGKSGPRALLWDACQRVDECHAAGEPPALAHGALQLQWRYPQLPAFP